ncbi:unnamed protein product [Spirodela intermedia]|uniref:Uncharacterized protein n=1 Tax=Spirodela intermedia TaxID=51605 RepID=A0A7I8IN53_SPIIN|nr:unnamed protein product [Spirodela intermedia]CAA6658578.1 unnamed protein product [Spirodela intermedia]
MAAAESGSPPALPLLGRVAIVTGASRGSAARSPPTSPPSAPTSAPRGGHHRIAVAIRAIAVRADVFKAVEVKALFDAAEAAFGGAAHILVSSAGVLDPKYPPLAATPEEDWDATFAVNAKGVFLPRRRRRIINISSSVVGSLFPRFAAYAASKAAVEAMTKVLAKELRGTGITANCVAPGREEDVKRAVDLVPLGRLGETEDIAPVVGFLASDAGQWINGQVVRVNGGYV